MNLVNTINFKNYLVESLFFNLDITSPVTFDVEFENSIDFNFSLE